jgi:hypothetical protein
MLGGGAAEAVAAPKAVTAAIPAAAMAVLALFANFTIDSLLMLARFVQRFKTATYLA